MSSKARFALPRQINVDVTGHCNQHCAYCCFVARKAESGVPDCNTAAWRRFFAEAGNAGVFVINLRGGEPLTRPDFRTLVTEIVRHRMRFRLLTNGLLLDGDCAEFLAATNRCNGVKISLDGTEALHDCGRGRGTHAKALSAIRHVRKVDLPLEVCCAVHKHNFQHLECMANYFFDELRLPSLSFSAVQPQSCGKADWHLKVEELYLAFQAIAGIERRYGACLPDRSMVGTIRRWRKMWNDPEYRRTKRFGECTGFQTCFAVRADGEYMPCPALSGVGLGNMADTTLDVAFERLHRTGVALPAAVAEKCMRCRYLDKCSGGCPASGVACGCLADFIEFGGAACL